jgi:hypothetical protein
MAREIDEATIDAAEAATDQAFDDLATLVENKAGREELERATERFKFLLAHQGGLQFTAKWQMQFPGASSEAWEAIMRSAQLQAQEAADKMSFEEIIASAKDFAAAKQRGKALVRKTLPRK